MSDCTVCLSSKKGSGVKEKVGKKRNHLTNDENDKRREMTSETAIWQQQ